MIFSGIHRRALAEATDILETSNRFQAITGADPSACLDLAKKMPPELREAARHAVTEGMSLEQVDHLFTDTFLSGLWQLGLAGRDTARAIVGAPTVGGLLTPDEMGLLSEIKSH